MTAHVHQRAAAGLVHVVKPFAVRPGMFLALAHLKDFPDRAFVHQFADALVLRREAKFLGVHQLPIRRLAGRDHLVRFLEVHRKRLFDDHMFAGLGRREHGAVVQKIGDANVHHVAAGLRNGFVEVF